MPKPSVIENPDSESRVLQVPRLPGFAHVARVFAGPCPVSYTASVRLVGLTLAAALDKSDSCFVRVTTLGARCNLKRRAVQNALRVLTADPPMFARQRRRGQSSVFKLVRHPDAFVARRDEVRHEHRTSEAKAKFMADYRALAGVALRSMDSSKVTTFKPSGATAGPCADCGKLVQVYPDGRVGDFEKCLGDNFVRHVCPRNEPEPA